MKKPIKVFERNSISYDSDEEVYMSMYLDELKESGYIKNWLKNHVSFTLCEPENIYYIKETRLKTKTKLEQKTQSILKGSVYTPDFKIIWNKKAELYFYQLLKDGERIVTPFIAQLIRGKICSVVEVKPGFDRNNMTRLFVNNQKFLWAVRGIYTNLIVPQELFFDTFTPKEYLKTNKTGKARKINWLTKTLKDYTNDRT